LALAAAASGRGRIVRDLDPQVLGLWQVSSLVASRYGAYWRASSHAHPGLGSSRLRRAERHRIL